VPRKPRILVPDVVYHVGSRGGDKRPIFDVVYGDRSFFLVLLGLTVNRYGWRCHSYCLMGNHFHLVVDTPKANLDRGMQYLKGRYAMWLNEKCGRVGALFERRYFDELVLEEAYAYELVRYVALNPVRANLCLHPRDWPWGSYPAHVGLVRRPAFLCTDLFDALYGPGPRGIALFDHTIDDGIALTELARTAGVRPRSADRRDAPGSKGHGRGLTPVADLAGRGASARRRSGPSIRPTRRLASVSLRFPEAEASEQWPIRSNVPNVARRSRSAT